MNKIIHMVFQMHYYLIKEIIQPHQLNHQKKNNLFQIYLDSKSYKMEEYYMMKHVTI